MPFEIILVSQEKLEGWDQTKDGLSEWGCLEGPFRVFRNHLRLAQPCKMARTFLRRYIDDPGEVCQPSLALVNFTKQY